MFSCHHSAGTLCQKALYLLFLSPTFVVAFHVVPYPNGKVFYTSSLDHTDVSSVLNKKSAWVLQQQRNGGKMFQLRMNSENNSNEADGVDLNPSRPISLPSLENLKDVGPLYNTCRSVTGVENESQQNGGNDLQYQNLNEEEESTCINKKPIELESLRNQDIDRSFLGLQPRSRDGMSSGIDEDEVPLLMETGLGLFTSSLILGGSIYFILAVFLDGDNVDPTAIPLSF